MVKIVSDVQSLFEVAWHELCGHLERRRIDADLTEVLKELNCPLRSVFEGLET